MEGAPRAEPPSQRPTPRSTWLTLRLGFAGSVCLEAPRLAVAAGSRPAAATASWPWPWLASIVLRSILLLFIDNSEPRYTLEFFPVFFVWIGAFFDAQHPSEALRGRDGG